MIKVFKFSKKDELNLFRRFIGNIPFDSNSLWFGASIHNIPCGVLLANSIEKNLGICSIDSLFVHPMARRMGVATKLLNALIEETKIMGYNQIVFNSTAKKEVIDEIDLFLKNYGFDTVKIEANVYTISPNSMIESGKLNYFANRKIIIPKGIKIFSESEIDKNLIKRLKEKIDVDYPKIYDPFPENNRFRLKHINTFFAVSNFNEIVAWVVGLDAFETSIYYKTLFVKEKYRNLALGLILNNTAIKNHIEKYPSRSALFAVSQRNPRALKFVSKYFKGIEKDIEYEFIFEKTLQSI